MTARKSIFDIIKSKYDIKSELLKIKDLFSSQLIGCYQISRYGDISGINWCTLESIADHYFKDWEARGTCINTKEMKNLINLDETLSNIIELRSEFIDVDDVVHCLEYYINIIILARDKYISPPNEPQYRLDQKYKLDNRFNMLLENIEILLDKLNHEKIYSKETEELILIPKDPAATSVAEISTEETGMAILMYHHRQLKGNLEGKRDILLRMSKEYEPLINDRITDKETLDKYKSILSFNNGYPEIFKTATSLLNNLHIRHNNIDGKKGNGTVSLSDSELERWYDETYQIILFCVLAKDNAERRYNSEELIKSLNQKSI